MHRFAAALVALGLVATPSIGWTEELVPQVPPRQQLGQHLFIPRDGVIDPFTTSFVASSSGVASGGANGPTFDLQGKQVSLEDYKILAYSQLFTGQWGWTDWWALRFKVLGSAYTGANASGAAGVGVNGVVRGSFGTTLGFRLAENLRVGAVVDVAWGPSVALSILDAIRDSISAGSVQTPVENTYSTTVNGTLSLAWTITRGLGGIFNASYLNGVVEVNQGSSDQDMLAFQGALDLDLRELGSIPLGLALDYSAGYSTGNRRFRRYVLGLGLFYTGRPGLTLGLDLGYRRAPLGTHDVFVTSFSGVFSLRFSFD